MSSIPAHRSTIELLQQFKPKTKNWDEFLLAAFEDWLPPETVRELDHREQKERSRRFSEVERSHPRLRRLSR